MAYDTYRDPAQEGLEYMDQLRKERAREEPSHGNQLPHHDWLDPEPLSTKRAVIPFPVEALPELLKNAVIEAQAYIQAPLPLVINSALGAVSVCAQGVVNVARDDTLIGPICLYLLSKADSGERKSACDSIFVAPVKQRWEAAQLAEYKTAMEDYQADLDSWKAEREGIKGMVQKTRI